LFSSFVSPSTGPFVQLSNRIELCSQLAGEQLNLSSKM
jgi:hypothetical protein